MQLNDWLGLGLILGLAVFAVMALSRLARPYEVSSEEYERRVNEGPGVLGAGLIGLQKALDPGAEKAIEVQQDLRAGHLGGEQESGEGDGDGEETGQQ